MQEISDCDNGSDEDDKICKCRADQVSFQRCLCQMYSFAADQQQKIFTKG